MDYPTLRSLIFLQLTPRLGPVLIKNLIAYCGSPEAVVREKPANLAKIPGVGAKIGENLKNVAEEEVDEELQFIEDHGVQPLYFLEKDYPDRLKDLDDAPPLLFLKGNTDLNKQKLLGIVGTRRATSYGKDRVRQVVEDLSSNDVTIVSGLAHGIDEMGHQAALKNDLETIGVLGHGLSHLYPAQNQALAEKISAQGGLLTEFPSSFGPLKDNFPARNRIIGGMVDGLLVAETGTKGGALITAEIAYSYNRELMVFPGRSIDSRSAGCNHLIKMNKAYLVENGVDVAFHLGWDEAHQPQKGEKQEKVETTAEEDTVLKALNGVEKQHINNLAYQLEYSVSQLSVLLFTMELKGLVKALPGDNYCSV